MENRFGDNVRKFRVYRGMSQKELAERVGYTDRSMIAKIETGRTQVSQPMIMRIAEALQVNPSIFFADDKDYDDVTEFLPFLAVADERILESVRKLLDMPPKKR